MSKDTLEIRRLSEAPELRAQGDIEGTPSRLIGYAAVFGQDADLGEFRERFMPGAFTRTLREAEDIRALMDHATDKILGRTSNGTLRLSQDDRGLRVEIDLPDTSYAGDLRASVQRGDIAGMSVGFRARDERFIDEGGNVVRELYEVDIVEVTTTSIPAYQATELELRVAPEAARRAAEKKNRPRLRDARRKFLYQLARG